MTSKHALIIDDNITNLQVLETLLNKQGVTHTSLNSPLQIEATLGSLDHLDLVFLDLEMPDADGYTVLNYFKTLQQNGHFDEVPVIAYTVHVSEFQTAYQAGFHSFIPKPVDPKRFPDQLQRILQGERVWERV